MSVENQRKRSKYKVFRRSHHWEDQSCKDSFWKKNGNTKVVKLCEVICRCRLKTNVNVLSIKFFAIRITEKINHVKTVSEKNGNTEVAKLVELSAKLCTGNFLKIIRRQLVLFNFNNFW